MEVGSTAAWSRQVSGLTDRSPVHGASEERCREPSHSRAGLTSIGLEINRTPPPAGLPGQHHHGSGRSSGDTAIPNTSGVPLQSGSNRTPPRSKLVSQCTRENRGGQRSRGIFLPAWKLSHLFRSAVLVFTFSGAAAGTQRRVERSLDRRRQGLQFTCQLRHRKLLLDNRRMITFRCGQGRGSAHPRQTCTCNRSLVDAGLITALIWLSSREPEEASTLESPPSGKAPCWHRGNLSKTRTWRATLQISIVDPSCHIGRYSVQSWVMVPVPSLGNAFSTMSSAVLEYWVWIQYWTRPMDQSVSSNASGTAILDFTNSQPFTNGRVGDTKAACWEFPAKTGYHQKARRSKRTSSIASAPPIPGLSRYRTPDRGRLNPPPGQARWGELNTVRTHSTMSFSDHQRDPPPGY
ncbi:hypothetical protein FQA47_005437 [Oryzias melastigma]|uniref:Uncharacterized protein n=1 Tax=Oryzias melastigma TaxID=30732 RepID=A0A834EZA9_ORYME|nr:hypothetical protein FQA47_005437 [Oryzias melastigma]